MWGGRTVPTPCCFTPAPWAGGASTQLTPEQGAAALSKEPESNYVWLFGPSSGLCPHPTVTAAEHTWVIGNESTWPCTKKTLCANRGQDLALAVGPALEKGRGGDSWKSISGPPRSPDAGRSQHKGTPLPHPLDPDACPEPGCVRFTVRRAGAGELGSG